MNKGQEGGESEVRKSVVSGAVTNNGLSGVVVLFFVVIKHGGVVDALVGGDLIDVLWTSGAREYRSMAEHGNVVNFKAKESGENSSKRSEASSG
ncbi:hypothetical protein Tco_0290949 [Tanacetum coccineum]